MKPLISGTCMAIAYTCSVSAALAANGTRADDSGLLVWAFLGFCALIVVVQLIPAIIILASFVIALVKNPQPQHHAETDK